MFGRAVGFGEHGGGAADGPEADDAERPPAQLLHLRGAVPLPPPHRRLHLDDVLGEPEHREDGPLRQRVAEDAAGVGDDHIRLDELGEEQVVDTSEGAVSPFQRREGRDELQLARSLAADWEAGQAAQQQSLGTQGRRRYSQGESKWPSLG